jgi:glycosyltransferase involved in cell wall biosynthesis
MPRLREKRVLHIIDSFHMGGAETWLMEIVRYAHETGHPLPAFDFVAAGGEKAIFDDEIIAHGCRIFYLKLDKRNIFSFIRGFRKILRENEYHAIHDHQDFLSGWHLLFGAGLLPNVRISHVHNPYDQLRSKYGISLRRRLNILLGRRLNKLFSTHILGTSARLMGECGLLPEMYPSQKVGPLYCAFRLDRFSGSHGERKRVLCEEMGWDYSQVRIVLFAGRLDPRLDVNHPENHKNSAFALEVIHTSGDPDIRMVMAGTNEYIRDEFMGLVRRKGLEGRVRLLGVRNDMPDLMLASDVLLFPSRMEGLGMVAVEAQAAGLPVLASVAVPSEITVINELVRFMGLDEPLAQWASMMRDLTGMRGAGDTTTDARWKESGFNIKVCCDRLYECYVNHRLDAST